MAVQIPIFLTQSPENQPSFMNALPGAYFISWNYEKLLRQGVSIII